MGWFGKKEKEKKKEGIPSLPELPKLPEFPEMEKDSKKSIHRLPNLPNNSLGEKFSQDTIKEAITGKKEVEGSFKADEFALENNMQRMQEPQKKSLTKEISHQIEKRIEVPKEFKGVAKKVKEIEPIFIRIDKFEEGVKTFERIKEKISEIEKLLEDTKRVKEEEERELETWENEIKSVREQIEKVDKEIFSKIE